MCKFPYQRKFHFHVTLAAAAATAAMLLDVTQKDICMHVSCSGRACLCVSESQQQRADVPFLTCSFGQTPGNGQRSLSISFISSRNITSQHNGTLLLLLTMMMTRTGIWLPPSSRFDS
uniref:Putative secreted protein n=1 Tax=Anopheles darlingi TaxID=43151 RepID=A0A2M4DH35_ANODA